MRKSGIYCIENLINHKKYIGQSVYIRNRWRQHKNELNSNIHFNDYLQKSWNKYGADNFSFYVLEYCDVDQLDIVGTILFSFLNFAPAVINHLFVQICTLLIAQISDSFYRI